MIQLFGDGINTLCYNYTVFFAFLSTPALFLVLGYSTFYPEIVLTCLIQRKFLNKKGK